MKRSRSGPALRELSNGADRARHRCQFLGDTIFCGCRDHQPFLRPGHADVEEFHVLGGLGFRGVDLAEADEGERRKT